ncbi:hypothetical protein OAS96_03505 [Candidatus Pelagibacter sp.]|nr:hypothetical protein [Candidatus Pelagibacter sp.]
MQIINKFLRLRKVYIYFISYVLFIIIFSTSFLQANTFKVSNIDISSPFELNFNKTRVIDGGFKESFFNLLSMITTSSDREKLKNTSLKEIKGMIDSFTISDEKFINNEYFAKLESSFNKKKTLSFLEKKNVFPSTPIRNKILLIPILVDAEQEKIYLFTDNIFYEKWNTEIKNYHLLEYLLPSEDLEDMGIIQKKYDAIENHDFLNLIKKYDLEDYIITIIYESKDEIKILSKINLNNSFKIDNKQFEKKNLTNEEDFKIVLDVLKNTYENYWKKENEINTSIKLPLTLSINSKKYNEVIKLEKILDNLDLVSDFYITKFDNNNTYYRIIYNGSPKTFYNDLNKNDLNLKMENNIWIIK